ncbi:hypothetical protein BDQ17DRAFT_1428585 [Cyathus striatus]|nr:hypothetical protein BDQ17DRAFT_1428585 [Cyathus striatus]
MSTAGILPGMSESPAEIFVLVKEALNIHKLLVIIVLVYFAKVYDVCITLDTEIEFIWKSPWNSMKVIYLLTRYAIFVDSIMELFAVALPTPSEHTCLRISQGLQVIYTLGIAIGDLILTTRAWAFWQTTKHITIMLSLFWAITWTAEFGLTTYSITTYRFGVQELAKAVNLKGCILTSNKLIIAPLTLLSF